MHWFVIINPVAGKGLGKKHWAEIKQLLSQKNINFDFCFTEYKNHIKEIIAEQVTKNNHHFLICGGDGSLSEAVNAVMNLESAERNKILLGVIPIGSGNDWCRTHNISNNYETATEQFITGTITKHDVGFVEMNTTNTKHYFINIAGAGYDGFVVDKINTRYPDKKPDKAIYMLMLLKCLFGYKCSHATITAGNSIVNEKIFSMSVAICKYNGGGMMQAPQAIFNDGLLTVNIIKSLSKIEVIKNLSGLKDGSYIKNPKVISSETSEVILTGQNQFIEADGESLGMAPAKFGIVANAINFIVPKKMSNN